MADLLLQHDKSAWHLRPAAHAGRYQGRGARRLPGSNAGGDSLSVNQRVAAASRGTGRGGVDTTYLSGWPTAHAVDLIRLGAKTATTVSRFTAAARRNVGAVEGLPQRPVGQARCPRSA